MQCKLTDVHLLSCHGVMDAGSSMAVEGVKWGTQGPFAFNVWVEQATNKGSMFQYVISTRSRDLGNVTDDDIFYPNQVRTPTLTAPAPLGTHPLSAPFQDSSL